MSAFNLHFKWSVWFQLGAVALALAIAVGWQSILDEYALLTFHPSAQVGAIESRLQLTASAKAIFYRARPEVDSKQQFARDCQTKQHELELGCYYKGRVYVLEISNPSLAPEMDVVMAHELLHAAWARTDDSERAALGSELEAQYASINDSKLRQRMHEYALTEPGQQTNELHSILGTEFGGLAPTLERHYRLFFKDRLAIVADDRAYENVFNQQLAQLNRQRQIITTSENELTAMDNDMSQLKSDGLLSRYNDLVASQNSLVDEINADILQYNQKESAYNALAASLDSQPAASAPTSSVK